MENKDYSVRIHLKYIQTTTERYKDVYILECVDTFMLNERIKRGEVIKVEINKDIVYINSRYIMYYEED